MDVWRTRSPGISPLPTWMLLAAIFINWMIIALIQVVLLLLLGRFGYDVHGPP